MENVEAPEFQFFYVAFTFGSGMWGSKVLKQHFGPNGFNYSNASMYLMQLFGCAVVITFVQEINEQRHNEFARFCKGLLHATVKPDLKPITGGGETSERPPGVTPLRPVPTPGVAPSKAPGDKPDKDDDPNKAG